MMNREIKVRDDLVVSLDYTLRLDDGQVVDTSIAEDRQPLEFLQGHGQIIAGLEQEIYEMTVGEEKDVVVQPAEGYGEWDPEAVELVPQEMFRSDTPLQPGMLLHLRDDSGETFDAYVADLRPDGVVLDFNHPLAGETLFFSVKIAGLRPATHEELSHGHVHGDEHQH